MEWRITSATVPLRWVEDRSRDTHENALLTVRMLRELDRSRFELFVYARVMHADALTHRLKGLGLAWRDCATMSDAEVHAAMQADRIDLLRSLSATRWQIFKDVLIWESLQPTFVGLRSAISMALVIVIVAEMFIGSDNGLGHRIIDAQQVLNVKTMYAAILAAGALGYALNVLFLLLERRIVHWSGR